MKLMSKAPAHPITIASIISLMVLAIPANAQVPVALGPNPKLQFFNTNGTPCVGCKVFTYNAGTSTPAPSYTDSTGATQNTNPIILDSNGECNFWLAQQAYKIVLQNSLGSQIWSVDGVNAWSVISLANTWASLQTFNAGAKGFFVTSSANPATAGVLRAASSDNAVCWLSFSGVSNICLGKNNSDQIVLPAGGLASPNITTPIFPSYVDFTEIPAPVNPAAGNDRVYTDSTTHKINCITSSGTSCNQGGVIIYSTQTQGTAASIGPITIAQTNNSLQTFKVRLQFLVSQTVATVGCAPQPSLTLSVTYADAANAGTSTSLTMANFGANTGAAGTYATTTMTFANALGQAVEWSTPPIILWFGKTLVFPQTMTYTATYAAGAGCGTGATYQVQVIAEQIAI